MADIAESKPLLDNKPKDTKGETETALDPYAENIAGGNKNTSLQRTMKGLVRLGRMFFQLLCLVSGQYAFPKTSKVRSILCTIFFFSAFLVCLLNIVPFIVTVLDWALCPTEYDNVCYSIILHSRPNTTDIPNIVLLGNTQNEKLVGYDADSLHSAQNDLETFEIYAKIVLLITAFSGTISYLLFFVAFTSLYFVPHLRAACLKKNKVEENGIESVDSDDPPKPLQPLHPFDDADPPNEVDIESDDNNTSTQLTRNEAFSYYGMLTANIAIIVAMVIVFVCGQYTSNPDGSLVNEGRFKNIANLQKYEIAFVATYTYSLYCTLLSCFIFSKIAYGIQRKCKSFQLYLDHVDKPQESLVYETNEQANKIRSKIFDYLEDKTDQNAQNQNNTDQKKKKHSYEEDSKLHVKLYYLQKRDRHFSKVAKKSLKVFERWFFFHWILYIVSSFLSLSLFLEAIIHYINSSLPNQQRVNTGIDFHPLEIIFLGLFSASNCLFFLYPCIRAAKITDARASQIRHINQIYATDYQHITPELKGMLVNYLNSQSFGFNLHILCAKVPFGFSVAYISIFIALFGVLLKVVSSV